MGKSNLKNSVLPNNDVENQAATVNEPDYVSLSGAPAKDSKTAKFGCASARSGKKREALLIGCTSTILLLLGAFAVHNLRSEIERDGKLLGEQDEGSPDYDNEFYEASRTGYHFQPLNNWMNDPNGPLFYKGYYHFFFQYNPKGVEDPFYKLSWGHSVSTDLIHWQHLELPMSPDKWYDDDGVWSGSATILKDGTPAIVYTGVRNMMRAPFDKCDQTQNVAFPVDPSDPLLRKWKKADVNPVIFNPEGIDGNDFRDPTTAWLEQDGLYRFAVGAKKDRPDGTQDGMALLYKSSDFVHWEPEGRLYGGLDTGMWECVDFFPISVRGEGASLQHSQLGPETFTDDLKYVLKAGLQVWEQDHYILGSYSTESHKFTIDDPKFEMGKGSYRYDYGKFFASKSFFDPQTGRRIIWGWANESDSTKDQIIKGWASVQAIPRVVWLDNSTLTNLIVWPVEELEALRGDKTSYQDLKLTPGEVIKVGGGDANQLDIEVVFEKPDVGNSVGVPEPVDFDCGQGGSAHRGIYGPFGLLVHADANLIEHTGVFFYVSYLNTGHWATMACSDQSRSSLASDLDKTVYGTYVPLLATEKELKMRILVDHSIVETFVQGGKFAITSRVYPTVAIGKRTELFLFNNGTTSIHVISLDVYPMATVNMTTYPQ